LLGIIREREIWATDTQHLNDQREYRLAIDMVSAEIERQKVAANGEDRWVLSEMLEGIRGIEGMNVCVCSFSEDRDSLPQWRAYGGLTSGYAIGFNPGFLADVAKRERFLLAKCLYKQEEQAALIQALVAVVFSENVRMKEDGRYPVAPQGGYLAARLHKYAPILKHPSFAEEREWRMISLPLSCRLPRFEFRPGKSMAIPYYRVPLKESENEIKLDEVVIGPTPHIEQSCNAARNFLVSRGLEDVPVNMSAVPYRNW
jgi:hypothetical protein